MTIRKVTRRGKPVLVIDIVYRDAQGAKQRYRRDAQVQTMTAARAEERRLIGDLAAVGSIEHHKEPATAPATAPSSAPSWQASLERYLAVRGPTLKPSTRSGYEEVSAAILTPRWGERPVDSIDHAELLALDASLASRGASSSRRRNAQIVARSVLKHALAREGWPTFPPLPRVGSKVVRAPSEADVARLIEFAPPALTLPILLAYYAGLRAGEVRGLKWCDIDLRGRELLVRRAVCRGVEAAPKSGSERRVPLAEALFAALSSARRGSPDSLVCPSPKSKRVERPWSECALSRATTKLARRLGLRFSFHGLRHAFCTALFRRTTPANVVQELLGHSNLTVTQRYAHATSADRRAAVALLN